MLTGITDALIPKVKAWQNRPLDGVYPIVWLDAIHFKVREEGRVISKAVYCVLGLNQQGKKNYWAMYVGQNESASFWLNVLTELKNRGVEDILIACIDNLKGFKEQGLRMKMTRSFRQNFYIIFLILYIMLGIPIRKTT